ncbi:MAG TPA: UDP-N-acetylglucosamine 1-carboxyvinyltransferase, partial [Clostridia bacterium]|nr:UDP-N-acetylglucosamine 1-carboxyvinyltransferase [Clostridia bacterium]
AQEQLTGSEIYLDMASVGATINIMLAAVMAKGKTTIVNSAKEPHIVDLANFLNTLGASVKGAGTDIIRINGVNELKGSAYSIIPDQIETGTWMIIAAATKGDITIHNCIPPHMEAITSKLLEAGANVEVGEDYIRVYADRRLRHVNIKTLTYPGFPTDLQQPIAAAMTVAEGTSVIIETIFENRFKFLDEIRRMGAKVRIEDRVAVIEGVDKLQGAPIAASDLRGSAALVVAGLIAEGITEISNILYIKRGYENFIEKLNALGAQIEVVEVAK